MRDRNNTVEKWWDDSMMESSVQVMEKIAEHQSAQDPASGAQKKMPDRMRRALFFSDSMAPQSGSSSKMKMNCENSRRMKISRTVPITPQTERKTTEKNALPVTRLNAI